MTARGLPRAARGPIDAAIAAGAYELAALRLALGVLAALREIRPPAYEMLDELLALADELGSGR